MKRREILIMAALLVGSIITIFLPDTKPKEHVIGPKELLYAVNQEGRYVSTDQVAKAIMEGDQSYLIIDVRSPEEYKKYSIDGAINVPQDSIMKKIATDEIRGYFDQDIYTTVLYSNGSSKADQTWLALRSLDYHGNKVMKGGLNQWYKTILNPEKPADDILVGNVKDQYLFRKGAQVYFTGANPVGSATSAKPKKSSKPIVKRKKKEVSGGCG